MLGQIFYHIEEGKCTNISFPVLWQSVWMINNNKRCNNIYFIFFSENNLILPKQSGFRARYSSTNQLLSIAPEILPAFAGSYNTKSQEYFSTYLKCLIGFGIKTWFSSYNSKLQQVHLEYLRNRGLK